MPIIEWSAAISVGDGSLDRQHQHLIAQINALYDCLRAPDPLPLVDRVLHELVAYVGYHFADEERMMIDAGYPGVEAHIRSHRWLTEQVQAMVADYSADPRSVMVAELFEFLSEWLINHIQGEDVPLRPWIAPF